LNPKRRPLIFVPGIRTSRLAIRKEDGSLEHFWPLMPHEFLIKAKLERVFHYLETNIRLRADDNDDDEKVVATSLIPFAYDGLIKSILGWGYRPNFDFWIFPYDWRQSNKISGQLLAKFIEEKIEDKCDDGVDIISHSMGGIIARAASLSGAPIRRAAYIGCPHLGSPVAYFILHPQIDSRRFIGSAYHNYPTSTYWQPNNDTKNNNNTERRKTLYHRRKELFIKFPSMYELLPDESYLRNRAILLTDGRPKSCAEDTYLKNDWAFEEKDMRNAVINAMEFKRELGEGLPRQDVLLVCGTNQLTCDTVHYRTSYHASITERRPIYLMQQGFSLPYDSGQGGDGYVPITSAMASTSETPTYSNSLFIPEAHTVLSNAKATIEAISRFLGVG
jgi:pimeloyl-ACP methyl ester carboxylesterase